MVMSLIRSYSDVVFDYIFVVVFRMGTFGAAWGTFLSITVSMIIGLLYFLKYSQIRFCKPNVNWKVLLKSCTNGSSEMLTELSTGITTFLFNIIIMKYFGEDGVAAVTIIMYIYYSLFPFIWELPLQQLRSSATIMELKITGKLKKQRATVLLRLPSAPC